MKETSFNIGDKIVTIRDGELYRGTIKGIYPLNPPICAIAFEDGSIRKIFLRDIAPDPKADPQYEKTELGEKSEITITPDEFKKITCDIIAKYTDDKPFAALEFGLMMSKIHRALFIDSRDGE